MKKPTLLIYGMAALSLLVLPALFPVPKRDAERLRLVTSMAVKGTGTVTMAVSSQEVGDALPGLQLTAAGDSFSTAEDALRRSAGAEELYFAHLQYLLCSENTARASLTPLFDYAQRSSQMRLTIPLYIVRDDAAALIDRTGEKGQEITAALTSLAESAEAPDPGVLETVRSLSLRGSALVSALSAEEADDLLPTADKGVLLPKRAGYAVVKGDALLNFLPEEAELGAELLTGRAKGRELTLPCGATVKLTETEVTHRFREGDEVLLTMELRAGAALSGEEGETDRERAEEELFSALSDTLTAAADFITREEADFPGLYADFRRRCPESLRTREDFLAALRPEVTGEAKITFSYDTDTGEDDHEG